MKPIRSKKKVRATKRCVPCNRNGIIIIALNPKPVMVR